jgi:hypothetical protein
VVRLQLPAPTPAAQSSAKLLDLQGRVVRQWTLPAQQTAVELPLEAVAAGLYLVQVQTTAGTAQQRVAVQH